MRSTFGSSPLVRTLGEWSPVDAGACGMDFAERWSLWLNAFDAIRLQAAHQAIRAIRSPAAPPVTQRRASRTGDLAEDLRRLRATLARAIAQPVEAGEAAGYAPWQQRHAELQRQTDLLLGPLREHVRQVLSGTSARLHRLAAMDAALESMLAPREQAILPAVGALLERRHAQLREAGRQQDFDNEWRQAQLAELDLRLAPVAGLVEALGAASRNQS
ncbi:MAG TPA: DUF3348 family protein [Ramlibacter sp.]